MSEGLVLVPFYYGLKNLLLKQLSENTTYSAVFSANTIYDIILLNW